MKSLADLLLNHAVPGVRDAHIRHTIAEEFTNFLKIPIEPKQVKYKDGEVVLSVPPVVKSAVKLNFEAIQKILAERDIRVSVIK